MSEFEDIKETILKDAPRFTENDRFKFSCHKGLGCYTRCCADVTIFLTPYDIIRMKNRLGISSDEFLARYTIVPFNEKQQLPVVVIRMKDEEGRPCPFVSAEGCTIYEDRPWSCRMYPLGLASPKESSDGLEGFYFLMDEGDCRGFEEDKEWTVFRWLENQGILEYNTMGEPFKDITLHDYFQKGGKLAPEKMEMLYMACYNIDRFRRFVFESKFLQYFDVGLGLVNEIRNDDVELMKFAFRWLTFSLFNEPTMRIREDVLRTRKEQLMGRDQAL